MRLFNKWKRKFLRKFFGVKYKILILGHGRHGKDQFAEYLRDYHGFTFMSSSQAAAELIVFPVLGKIYGYDTALDCSNDRANHRTEWYDLILQDERDNPGRLTAYIFEHSDCYVGMRSLPAYEHCVSNHDLNNIVWVDRSAHVQPESSDSFKLDETHANYFIDNNGTLADLKWHVSIFVGILDS